MTRLADFYGRTVDEFIYAHAGEFNALLRYLETEEGPNNIDRSSEKNAGHTSVHFACYGNNNPGILYLLKRYGADLFKQDNFYRRPLMVAANSGRKEVIVYLLREHKKAGLSVIGPASLDCMGRSAVHAICCFGSSPSEKAEVFIKYGVDPAAVVMSTKEIAFKDRDFFFRTELMYNAFAGSLEIVQRELANGAKVGEVCQHSGRNSLHLACGGIAGPVFLQVMMQQPDTDLLQCDTFGTNAFMFAVNSGRIDTVSALVNGVTLADGKIRKFPAEHYNDQDDRGFTALHAAAMASNRSKSRIAVIKFLIETLGCDTTLKDRQGQTALELAESRGNEIAVAAITAAIAAKQAQAATASSSPAAFASSYANFAASTLSLNEQAKGEAVKASASSASNAAAPSFTKQ